MLKVSNNPYTIMNQCGWNFEDPFIEKLKIGDLNIIASGQIAKHQKFGKIISSSISCGEAPCNSSWYELLERINIIESINNKKQDSHTVRDINYLSTNLSITKNLAYPNISSQHFQIDRSNGVAIFTSWDEACRRACYQLIERHITIKSWVGAIKPEIIKQKRPSYLNKLNNIYNQFTVKLGEQRVVNFEYPISVYTTFLIPTKDNLPLAFGFGSDEDPIKAIEKSEKECLQRLAFTYGEDIPIDFPNFSPTPSYHLDFYLCPKSHKTLNNWIQGKNYNMKSKKTKNRANPIEVVFIDITTKPLSEEYFVVKAISKETIPLVFGRWLETKFQNIDKDLHVHPIA